MNKACAERTGIMPIIDGDTLSTMDQDTLNLYTRLRWAKNNFANAYMVNIPVDKLDNVLKEENIPKNLLIKIKKKVYMKV